MTLVATLIAVTFGLTTPSDAGLIIEIDDGLGAPVIITPTGVDQGDGTFDYVGTHNEAGKWSTQWQFNVDPDPHFQTLDGKDFNFYDTGNFFVNVTNDSIFGIQFRMSFMPDVPFFGQNFAISGAVRALADAANPALVIGPHTSGAPLYRALIGGTEVAQLGQPWPVVAADGSSFFYQDFAPTNIALPPSLDDFGIELNVAISPGASALITSTFVITAVPEPSTFILFVMSAACFFGYGMRRKRKD